MIKALKSSLENLAIWSEMIKLEHSLFSLPFVLSSAFLALNYKKNLDPNFEINFYTWLWIIGALVGARSAGMTLNRIIDAVIDAKNPRTKTRAIPASKISKFESWIFTILSLIVLFISAFQLPKLCQYLLPVVVIWIWAYPYFKRFSFGSHFFLGTTLGGATLGGWIAVAGNLDSLAPVYIAFAVSFWVAGFDIIYAIQDMDFDKNEGLHSIPVSFGRENSERITKFLHFLVPLFLYLAGQELALGWVYKFGIFIILSLIYFEDRFFHKADLYLNLNILIPLILMLFVFLEKVF